jgi:putative transposase
MEKIMNNNDNEEQFQEIAGFRYGLISELDNPNLTQAEIKRMIREKAKRSYQIPYSLKTSISAKCIRKWLRDFKRQGIAGITPRTRYDKGKSRVLTQEEQDAFLSFLEKKPELTAKAAFLDLQKKGIIKNNISASSLSRLVLAHGLDKKNRMALMNDSGNEKVLKFSFKYPLECVQADVMHAFHVPDDKGRMKKAKLLTFLDDATRRILYSCFAFTEKALDFEKGIKWVLQNHGRIHRIYVDNGAPFISNQTKRILDILGIQIIHSRAYRPQGRGKQERFFRTARERCIRLLNPDDIQSLAQLNTLFQTWVECEYHRSPHKGLAGNTPLDAWLAGTKYIIPVDPSIDLDQVFLHRVKRKIYNDATFSFSGQLYEVNSMLIGKTVTVVYDPFQEIRELKVHLNRQYICDARLVDTYANTKVARNVDSKDHIVTKERVKLSQKKSSQINHTLSAADVDL